MENSGGGCFQKCLNPNYAAAAAAAGGSSSVSRLSVGITTTVNHISHDDAHQEMKSTEDFLASEMNKLSVQERSKALDDLHCVGEDLTETSELIETSLQEMDRILRERNDPIYNLALAQNKAYVEDPNFRLRFLRTNDHDATKAANQLVGFLTQKEMYFGRDKIARDITLQDLNEEDMDLLSAGLYHIQDGMDRNGRMVLYILNHVMFNKVNVETMIRLNYFVLFNMLSPLEIVQRKGIVICYYDMSTPEKPRPLPRLDALMKYADYLSKVPIRRSAMHLCLRAIPGSLSSNNVILDGLLHRLEQSALVRARVHYGSDIELQYKLRGHGFPPNTIPVDISTGNIRKDILTVWFNKYVTNEWGRLYASASHMPMMSAAAAAKHPSAQAAAGKDNEQHGVGNDSSKNGQNAKAPADPPEQNGSKNNNKSIIQQPAPTDVLLGRGWRILRHPGNIRFREFLKEYQEEYNNTPRYKRVKTPKELTHLLLEDGVRFLQKTENGDGWVESSFSEAEKKVKQFFRSGKKAKP